MEKPRKRRRLSLELDERLEEALRRIGGDRTEAARQAILRRADLGLVLERLDRIEAHLGRVDLREVDAPAAPAVAAELAHDLLAGFGADEADEEERR